MDKETYIAALKATFASQYSFLVKAQGFHWNVEGTDFAEYHELFGNIYSEVYDSIDTFAEEIRALQAYAPGSLSQLSVLTKITDENAILDIRSMTSQLYEDCETMANMFRDAYKLADEMGDFGLANFLADRQDAFKKHCWMLRSSLK